VADFNKGLHCLDAETGKCLWVQETGGPIWGSTLVADGKVYLGTLRQTLWILAAGRQRRVISKIRMRDRISTTPVAANGVLYVATAKHLYAVARPAATGQ
jgi:outer membrane protein assembly factor BamB